MSLQTNAHNPVIPPLSRESLLMLEEYRHYDKKASLQQLFLLLDGQRTMSVINSCDTRTLLTTGDKSVIIHEMRQKSITLGPGPRLGVTLRG